MPKTYVPWQVEVLSFGPVTHEILMSPSSGEVCALFNRTFYVKAKTGLFCVGTEALHNGPLNFIAEAPSTTDWRASGVRLGEGIVMGARHLTVGSDLSFFWGEAQLWSPPLPEALDIKNLSKGLKNLRHAIFGRVPVDGLGCFLSSNPYAMNGSSTGRSAHATIAQLRMSLDMAFQGRQTAASLASELAPLIGMGPGLTPSGDDFIGGMMIGLHAIGYKALAAEIWECIKIDFMNKTNFISSAHVSAAAMGIGADNLHYIATTLCLGGDVTEDLIAALEKIGHTSGWDALTGMVTVLEVSVKTNSLESG